MTAAGLYVHVPFCSSRCSYCDFATGLYQSELAERYVRGLISEISASPYSGENVDTIYFGGGTPSLLATGQLERILTVVGSLRLQGRHVLAYLSQTVSRALLAEPAPPIWLHP